MRMSRWTPDIVRFMADAAERGTYFRDLAGLARGLVPRGGRVLDAGCGMGQLALTPWTARPRRWPTLRGECRHAG